MKKTYSEKLRDPRWQKKRLEIMNRDGFTCQWCDDKENTLNVHHLAYEGNNPWETSDKYLITLCERCHHSENDRPKMDNHIAQALRENGFSIIDICLLVRDEIIIKKVKKMLKERAIELQKNHNKNG